MLYTHTHTHTRTHTGTYTHTNCTHTHSYMHTHRLAYTPSLLGVGCKSTVGKLWAVIQWFIIFFEAKQSTKCTCGWQGLGVAERLVNMISATHKNSHTEGWENQTDHPLHLPGLSLLHTDCVHQQTLIMFLVSSENRVLLLWTRNQTCKLLFTSHVLWSTMSQCLHNVSLIGAILNMRYYICESTQSTLQGQNIANNIFWNIINCCTTFLLKNMLSFLINISRYLHDICSSLYHWCQGPIYCT